ncbi:MULTISPECIES: lantibiotic dehydratase C-terminal domain-containing protein [unclassified Nocardia]|uniref:lantibiotic dehydratase C-terminal domain-containing protein n=1 Tax=unclassified Nocardia TaxID=2637762 RepID=UPI001CE3F225|nr:MULTISPECIES: lantibiotic dehydratase C-terminal domain-containing protein [unclassified Nocardia]
MPAATAGWTEISLLSVPESAQYTVLREVLVPFLDSAVGAGLATRALYLRESEGRATTRLVAQLDVSPDAAAEIEARALALAHPGVAVAPAAIVPLADGSVFGGNDLPEITRGFLAGVRPTVTDVLRLGADRRDDLVTAALDLMVAHLPAVANSHGPGGVPLSYLSFRSHAEAFIATSKNPDGLRATLDARYRQSHNEIEQRVLEIFEQLDGSVSPLAAAWSARVRAAKPDIIARLEAGSVVVHTEYAQAHRRERTDFAANAFHRVVGASDGLQDYLSNDPRFLAARILTSLLYLSLHTVGLTLVERYYLCYVVSRACEAIYRVDGVSLVSRMTTSD